MPFVVLLRPLVVTSTKEVMFSLCLFVCLLAGLTIQPTFTKFGEKAARGPRKNPLDFGDNPDPVTLGLGLGTVRVTLVFQRNKY